MGLDIKNISEIVKPIFHQKLLKISLIKHNLRLGKKSTLYLPTKKSQNCLFIWVNYGKLSECNLASKSAFKRALFCQENEFSLQFYNNDKMFFGAKFAVAVKGSLSNLLKSWWDRHFGPYLWILE